MGGSISDDEGGPSRSLEVELKFDVDDDTLLPDLSGLPGRGRDRAGRGARARRPVPRHGRPRPRAGRATPLRRRSGGPDAGWHIKGPKVDGARLELHWPLADGIPEAVLAAVREVTDAALTPLARIRNHRIAYNLHSADGGVVAEFLDDHVVATDERSGTERTWREWEFELGPGRARRRRRSADALRPVREGCARRRRPGRGIRFQAGPHARPVEPRTDEVRAQVRRTGLGCSTPGPSSWTRADDEARVDPNRGPSCSRRRQRLIMCPARPWNASCSASDSVGCVCTLRAASRAVRSHFCASVSSGSSSDTSGPMRWPPSSSRCSPSAMSLTKPMGSPRPFALPFAENGNFDDLDVVAGVARLLLGEAERRDLRRAERRARHVAVVAERHGLGLADRLGGDDALGLGDVRELQLRRDIADRVDVGDRRVHVVVDLDRAAVG